MTDHIENKLDSDIHLENELLYSRGENKLQVVIYVDYTCENTRRVREVLRRTSKKFERLDLTLIIRFATTEQNNKSAEIAARAAIAANKQGRFPEMHDALFEENPAYSESSVTALAEKLNLDIKLFQSEMFSFETSNKIINDRKFWVSSVEVPHTPMLFIDKHPYQGVWDDTAILEAIERPLGVRLEIASNKFFDWAASAGFVLIVATFSALVLVNLGWQNYEHLKETIIGTYFGNGFRLEMPLEVFINDGLMSIFFLIVGIEIKREFLDGELSDPSRGALPIVAAIGGMFVPALIYYLININMPTEHGWGIPMATDIAFTLAILTLLGSRVPTSLKVLMSALAIVDDLGAIIIIALFYGHGFHVDMFYWAVGIFALMITINIARVYSRTPYLILGAFLWYFTFESGLHATLAGVLTAIAIPSRPSAQVQSVAAQTAALFNYELQREGRLPSSISVSLLKDIVERLREPGYHLQHALEKWSNYLILPLFAFFNTGVLILAGGFALSSPETLGTLLGLVVGKPIGIFLFVFIAVKAGIAKMSPEISWMQLLGAGCLAGIGFTMSIFIASAAFSGPQLQVVKLSVLIASVISTIIGIVILVKAANMNDKKSKKPYSSD